MKKLLILFFAFLLMQKTNAQDFIIKSINIIPMTSDTVLLNQSVLIKNGIISEIGDYKKFSRNRQTEIINGKGKFLLPGLADIHVHLPSEDRVEKLLLSNIAAGVTQIRIMNSVVPQVEIREKLLKRKSLISPVINYSHLISNDKSFTEFQADSLMRNLMANKISLIKILSLADEQTFYNLTNAALKHHITICGHYPVYKRAGKMVRMNILDVIKSDYKSIEHLGGYVWLQDDRQLDEALRMIKANNIYNCPTLDWDIITYNLQYPDDYKMRLTYQFLPDKFRQKWDREYLKDVAKMGGDKKMVELRDGYKSSFDAKLKVLKKLYEHDCLLLLGSDPGGNFQADGFNVYEEMANWSKAGIDNFTILKSSTVNPSKFLKASDKWGTVETGKNAQLIILGKNPLENINNITSVEKTIIGAKVFNNKKLLRLL